MSQKTFIQWCDSTLNLQMGCSGCELWNPKRKSCYAGTITEKYAGRRGWPQKFESPIVFHERIESAEAWKNLTGTLRIDKPHLNGYPRVVFLNDMGDTHDHKLDPLWLSPFIPRLEALPHIHIILTKRARGAREFWKSYGPVPENIWIGTTLTTQENLHRAEELAGIPARTPSGSSRIMSKTNSANRSAINGVNYVSRSAL